MKYFLTVICLAFALFPLSAQQIRRVYITLDVSGSMRGDKYTLANYTAQMIATLCDDDDEVCLIIGGNPTYLSKGANQLQDIQYPYSRHSHIPYNVTQFGDIVGFNRIYSPSSKKQDWLFIIGDGVWETEDSDYKEDRQKFKSTVESGQLNVCFLQTGYRENEISDFLEFVEPMGIVDIKKTSTSTKSIQEGCDFFAKKILGFSDVPLKVKDSGKNSITINSELPLSEFVVVYQQEVESQNLPGLQSAFAGGNSLMVTLKGTPTTTPVRTSADARLSGNVWRIESSMFIPAGETIELTFDKNVNPKNISIFPVIKELDFSSIGLTPTGNSLKRINSNVLSICKDEDKAVVKVKLNGSSRQLIPEDLLKRTKVEIKANNRSYSAKYDNGSFEAEIDLIDDETQYYAEIDCPGYFKRVTDITTIRKVECEAAEPVIKRNQVSEFGTMTFDQLKNGEIRGTFHDIQTLEILDPNKFDVTVEIDDDLMYETPRVRVEGNELVIEAHPLGDWCECLFPKELDILVVSRQKEDAFQDEGKRYDVLEQPIHLTIEKTRAFIPRCMWVIITLAILLVMLVYIRAIIKKHRFKKNARITSVYYNYYGSPVQGTGGRYLRKEGFLAWMARWFSPIDEKVTLSWSKPTVSAFTLMASDSKEIVNIHKKSFPAKTMNLPGYDPEIEDSDEKYIQWGDGETINVSQRDGGKDGDLTFVAGEEDDGAGFRIFMGILFVLCLVAFVSLAWMLLRTFL